MKMNWRVRSLLAMVLCATMVLTMLPCGIFVSNAVEPDAVELDWIDVQNDVSDGNVLEAEAATTDGTELMTYQSTKLKVSKKAFTLYAGQHQYFTITYDGSTSDSGLGFSYTTDAGLWNNCFYLYSLGVYNGKQDVQIQVKDTCKPGKYNLYLRPMVPSGVYAEPVTISLTIKAGINQIEMDQTAHIYKAAGKSASYQIKAIPKQKYISGYSSSTANFDYNILPASSLKWVVSNDIYGASTISGNTIKISQSGKLTIDKKSNITDFYVVVRPKDYSSNVHGAYMSVHVDEMFWPMTGATIVKNDYRIDVSKPVSDSRIRDSRLCVIDDEDELYDSDRFTYSSSNPNAISIDERGYIRVYQATGKPITLTATIQDGTNRKVSTKVTIAKTTTDVEKLKISGTAKAGDACKCSLPDLDQNTRVGSFSGMAGNCILELQANDLGGITDLSISKVTGGKDITAKMKKIINPNTIFNPDSKFYVLMTSGSVEITFKSGAKTQTYGYKSLDFKTEKIPFDSKKNKIKATTSISLMNNNDDQNVAIYIGLEHAGKKVCLNSAMDTALSSSSNYFTTYYLPYCGLYSATKVDSDGYARFEVNGVENLCNNASLVAMNYSGANKSIKAASSFKAQVTLLDDSGEKPLYAPRIITVKISPKSDKVDYNIKTTYDLTYQDGIILTWDVKECKIYTPITYSSTKTPTTKLYQVKEVKGELSADKENAGDLAKAVTIVYAMDNYQLAVSEETMKELQKNPANLGKKITGNMYLTYVLKTSSGALVEKTSKIKVSLMVPDKK